jgi:alkylated DNA repair dioxygenase AlkB
MARISCDHDWFKNWFFYFCAMNHLFPTEKIVFDLPNAEIEYHSHFFTPEKATILYNKLYQETPWQQDDIKVFNKIFPQPRLTALYGNQGKPYSYSNIIMQPHKWNAPIMFIKNEIETIYPVNFTTVLLNLYRNGKDSNGWHADNEKELGKNPIIASISLGAERMFHLQHNSIKEAHLKLNLEHGSLLIMKGETQHFWKHQIPKTAKPVEPRINLTFRIIR